MDYELSFAVDPPVKSLTLSEGANLSEFLTIENSPVLFGCRTGICGTCLIEVCEVKGVPLHEKSVEELDLLPIIAQGNPNARLACQIHLNTNLTIRPLKEA